MNGVLAVLAAIIPMLRDYFTKNAGLNTVSGGFLGAFMVIILQNQGQIDQIITWLQNQGEYGIIAGAFVAGLRVALVAYRAAKA